MREASVVVWLDRDGTVVDDPGYLRDPERLFLLPGAAEAIARLNRVGALVILVTNQSGIGRGLMSAEDVQAVHARLRALLAMHGAVLDDIRVCPHAPADACDCRKPAPGMVHRARAELAIDPRTREVVIGDKQADVELARAVGALAVLVRTGEGEETLAELGREGLRPDLVAEDLPGAVALVLGELGLADPGPTC